MPLEQNSMEVTLARQERNENAGVSHEKVRGRLIRGFAGES